MMVRKIIAYCEICYGADEILTEASTTESVSLQGRDYVMDLCDEHYKHWFQPFADLVAEHGMRASDVERASSVAKPKEKGRPETGKPIRTGKFPCIKPDCDQGFSHGQTMRQHVINEHADWIESERPDLTPEKCPVGCGAICFGNRGAVQHVRQGHPDQYEEWKNSHNGSKTNAQTLLSADA